MERTPLKFMFPPRLRLASTVRRWSVARVLNEDNIANHSFYVAIYARQIALLLSEEWEPDIGILMFRALTGDLDETVTGDICSPIKQEIIDNERSAAYIRRKMEDHLPFIITELNEEREMNSQRANDRMDAVIKAADKMDALIFLINERQMGNHSIEPSLAAAWKGFEGAWFNMPFPNAKLTDLWTTVIVPAMERHAEPISWSDP